MRGLQFQTRNYALMQNGDRRESWSLLLLCNLEFEVDLGGETLLPAEVGSL